MTNQSDLNKKGRKLDEINMPYFIVECMQQPNSYDCGFYVFRNIVGMMVDKRISPVVIKHIFKKATKEKFREILKSNQNQKEMKRVFHGRKSMKFTNECVVTFKEDIKRLFERFNDLNGAIDIKLEELAKDAKEKESEIDQKRKLTEMKEIIIESCSLEESAMSQSVLDDDLAKQSNGFLDFDSFFHDPKITKHKSVK